MIDWTQPGPDLPAMMRVHLRDEPWDRQGGWTTCPLCGEPWRPWARSLLPCHAKCIWTDEGALVLLRSPLSMRELSEMLGVTSSIVRAGIKQGRDLIAAEARA